MKRRRERRGEGEEVEGKVRRRRERRGGEERGRRGGREKRT